MPCRTHIGRHHRSASPPPCSLWHGLVFDKEYLGLGLESASDLVIGLIEDVTLLQASFQGDINLARNASHDYYKQAYGDGMRVPTLPELKRMTRVVTQSRALRISILSVSF